MSTKPVSNLGANHVGPLTLLTLQRSPEYYLRLNPSLFIAVQSSDTQPGAGLFITETMFNEASLKQSVTRLSEGHFTAKSSTLKLIGPEKLTNKAKEFFLSHGFKVEKVVVREGEYELYYYPSERRIRLSKDDDNYRALKADITFEKTRVLIVDDSNSIRLLLTKLFQSDPEIEVVGAIELPSKVDEAIQRLKPNLITLDIEMPEMDGVTLLSKIFPKYHIPTIMISSLGLEDGNKVLTALELGAVDYIQKPKHNEIPEAREMILEKIKTASRIKGLELKRTQMRVVPNQAGPKKVASPDEVNSSLKASGLSAQSLIAIGSSTGGTEALKEVLTHFPADIPPVVIVQHIPPVFSKAFADRLNTLCPFEVKEAEDGDEVLPNRVLIAPGGKQMRIKKSGRGLKIQITDDPPVGRHKPSVDYLFSSIAAEGLGANTIASILTGMGSDGATGMLELRNKGAKTLAEHESSCVVYGMPQAAFKIGAAEKMVPLEKMAGAILERCREKKAA